MLYSEFSSFLHPGCLIRKILLAVVRKLLYLESKYVAVQLIARNIFYISYII
jgi:hypothetical protein